MVNRITSDLELCGKSVGEAEECVLHLITAPDDSLFLLQSTRYSVIRFVPTMRVPESSSRII